MSDGGAGEPEPWYRRALRWGQTNLTELDPVRYDPDWWRSYWRRTRVQGVIVNAGGIVAYYPSELPLHHRARFLGDRDLYGEIVRAAREEGLAVLARMDSNRAGKAFYDEHPDWFAVAADGSPYTAGELFVSCINSPYYSEYLPSVLTEIIHRSSPDGVTDNSWSGLGREQICYCRHCARLFGAATGRSLPRQVDWTDETYRHWVVWSYQRRLVVWDLNNRVTREAGGPDCLWIGMNGGEVVSQSRRLRDNVAICERAPILMLDSQWRHDSGGFQANADSGKLLHGLLGWDRLIPESTAMYDAGVPTFRLGSKPAPEARMWAIEGFAGGIQPWWHHIGAYHEDRRQYRTAEPLFGWHERNQRYLVNRRPAATVGLVWSQTSLDFFGRDDPENRCVAPYRGLVDALVAARIPYVPVHIDRVERDASALAALVVPNLGAVTDAQADALRRYAAGGGGLVVTGETSRYDEWGEARPDFALADVLGVTTTGASHGPGGASPASWESHAGHSYLRLLPELRAGVDGPMTGTEPVVDSVRHPALAGFEEADVLGFGGRLEVVATGPDARVLASWVPPFPIYPPETSWMSRPSSQLPGLVVRQPSGGGRVAYLAADLDRCFARYHRPDHGRLLANVVRWAASDRIPISVTGPGVVDCNLYRQQDTTILHLVNLSHGGAWRGPIAELLPVGPLQVDVELASADGTATARLLVADTEVACSQEGNRVRLEIPRILDHEVVVLT